MGFFVFYDVLVAFFFGVAIYYWVYGVTFLWANDYHSLMEKKCWELCKISESYFEALPAPDKLYWKAKYYFYQCAIHQEKKYFDFYYHYSDSVLSFKGVGGLDIYYRNELLLQTVILKIIEGANFSALWYFYKVQASYNKLNQKDIPEESFKHIGLIEIIFSTLPTFYKNLFSRFGYATDFTRGYRRLAFLAEHSKRSKGESALLLFLITRILKQYHFGATIGLSKIPVHLQNTTLCNYLRAINELDKKNCKGAEEFLAFQNSCRIPQFDYFRARIAFFQGQYTRAIYYNNCFLGSFKGFVYKIDAMYKVAVSYLLTGDNLNAQNAFKAVTLMPQPYFDEDKYAYKMSKQYLEKKANETDLNLLKARYFFDGGFYESAIRTLNLINIESSALTVENKVEYYYRKGRIFHETNEFTQAKRHYLQAIVYKTEKPNWMVVYSLFYLGKILASENSEEAKRYFRRALSFDGYDYQAGLEQKVKAALSGLN